MNMTDSGTDSSVRLLCTIKEAAAALRIDPTTLYDLIRCNAIASVRIGRARRVSMAELSRFISEQETANAAASRTGGRGMRRG